MGVLIKGDFRPRKEIKMMSDQSGTVVHLEGIEWADLGWRERGPNETVHVREEQYEPCIVCGIRTGIWLENLSSHAIHPMRCSVD